MTKTYTYASPLEHPWRVPLSYTLRLATAHPPSTHERCRWLGQHRDVPTVRRFGNREIMMARPAHWVTNVLNNFDPTSREKRIIEKLGDGSERIQMGCIIFESSCWLR